MPEITGRLRPPRLASAPATPVAGEMYYDTATSKLMWWNGTTWLVAGNSDPPIVTYPARLPNAAAMASATAGERKTLYLPTTAFQGGGGQLVGSIPVHWDFVWNPSGWWYMGGPPVASSTNANNVTGWTVGAFVNHPWADITIPENGQYMARGSFEALGGATAGYCYGRIVRTRDNAIINQVDTYLQIVSMSPTGVIPWGIIGGCVKGDVIKMQIQAPAADTAIRVAQVEIAPVYLSPP